MKDKASEKMRQRDCLIKEIGNMEKDILLERHRRGNQGKSSFSYQLYERKLQNYEEQECWEGAALRERLQDIEKQQLINIEDNPLDEELRLRALQMIEKAKALYSAVSLTE